jgi:hypothetical protein
MVSEYGSLPFPICHQLLSGQLDQCARLSFPCSLYWIQSLQLIFLSTKLNTCVCVCVSCSDEFDYIALSNFGLFKELRYQLHSIFDKNLSIVRGWTFVKFFLKSKKNVKCRCIDEKKKSKCFVRKKNLSVRRKIFKVWKEKKCKCRISGVRKKKEIERKKKNSEKKNQSFFWMKILLSSCSLVGFYC